ncbi:histidine phosphatase family protein [Pseudomonas putida]|uniref:histidine phosphatase family protein n=1 Tax=Pseudomonas putida TaxID=303 RepID=UPI0018AB2901|nr:histidine phosphatase family protein [Pseudomonas putida]MBF8726763.1 histidine phosphatase family protein [Pseudomonas putida]MBF8764265.1 histidine phosphatase family protein [Pseudomonas putida]
MKRVRLIRHGESAANVGLATQDHASIPLTPRGYEQALDVARSFSSAPELIVVSPFARAQITANATAIAFPSATVETWPVQEFTYLEPERCIDTTVAQRKNWVDAYWSKSDPAYCDGVGAESFSEFIARAQTFLNRLVEHHEANVAVFSHGQFMNAVAGLVERKPNMLNGQAMSDWRSYEIEHHVQNAGGFILSKMASDDAWALGKRIALGPFQ